MTLEEIMDEHGVGSKGEEDTRLSTGQGGTWTGVQTSISIVEWGVHSCGGAYLGGVGKARWNSALLGRGWASSDSAVPKLRCSPLIASGLDSVWRTRRTQSLAVSDARAA